MGNFYTNAVVKTVEQQEVANAVREMGRAGLVAPSIDGGVIYLDRDSEQHDPMQMGVVGAGLSSRLSVPVLGVLNHDDDILMLWLFKAGEFLGMFNSCPDYLSEEPGEEGEMVDSVAMAQFLCEAYGLDDSVDGIRNVLESDEFVFAIDRHMALNKFLPLPHAAVGLGYSYAKQGELPPEISEVDLIEIDA